MPSIGGDRPLGSSVKCAAKFLSFSSGIPTIFTYSISLLAPPLSLMPRSLAGCQGWRSACWAIRHLSQADPLPVRQLCQGERASRGLHSPLLLLSSSTSAPAPLLSCPLLSSHPACSSLLFSPLFSFSVFSSPPLRPDSHLLPFIFPHPSLASIYPRSYTFSHLFLDSPAPPPPPRP